MFKKSKIYLALMFAILAINQPLVYASPQSPPISQESVKEQESANIQEKSIQENNVPKKENKEPLSYQFINILSPSTTQHIEKLNKKYQSFEFKPSITIVALDRLEKSIDDTKREIFNYYELGTKEENCGLLFVISPKDRKYALEIGDGYDKYPSLKSELSSNFIDNDITNDLRHNNYDSAILKIVNKIDNKLERANQTILKGGVNDNTNDKANDKLTPPASAKFLEVGEISKPMLFFMLFISLVIPFMYSSFKSIKETLYEKRKRKFVRENIDRYRDYFEAAKIYEYSPCDGVCIDKERAIEEITQILCIDRPLFSHDTYIKYFFDRYKTLLIDQARQSTNIPKKTLERVFNIQQTLYDFEEHKYLPLNKLIYFSKLQCEHEREKREKDREAQEQRERERREVREKNKEKVYAFLKANKHSIPSPSTNYPYIERKMRKLVNNSSHILSDKKVEKYFNDILLKIEFDRQVDEYLDQKGDNINRERFKREAHKSLEYKEYCDNSLLTLVMLNSLYSRYISNSYSTPAYHPPYCPAYNNSFPSSFLGNSNGGSSSGGGFSGGW